MRKQEIERNAGLVWRLTGDNRDWSYSELKQMSGLSDRELNAAIGWLAHDDRIVVEWDEDKGTENVRHPYYNRYF